MTFSSTLPNSPCWLLCWGTAQSHALGKWSRNFTWPRSLPIPTIRREPGLMCSLNRLSGGGGGKAREKQTGSGLCVFNSSWLFVRVWTEPNILMRICANFTLWIVERTNRTKWGVGDVYCLMSPPGGAPTGCGPFPAPRGHSTAAVSVSLEIKALRNEQDLYLLKSCQWSAKGVNVLLVCCNILK